MLAAYAEVLAEVEVLLSACLAVESDGIVDVAELRTEVSQGYLNVLCLAQSNLDSA